MFLATADQARDKRARSVSILGAEKASGERCTREISRQSRRRRTAALLSLLLPRERVAEIGVTGRNAECVHHAHRCVTCTTVQGPAMERWNEHLRMLPEDSSFDRARLGDQPRSSHFVASHSGSYWHLLAEVTQMLLWHSWLRLHGAPLMPLSAHFDVFQLQRLFAHS